MKTVCALFVAFFPLQAGDNALEIVRKAIENYRHDAKAALHYTYTTTDNDKNKGVDVTRTIIVDGTPYERLISRDGKTLSPEREKKEQEKYEKAVKERAAETPEQRAERFRKYEQESRYMEQAVVALDFRMLPDENLNGRPSYVIEALPKPGYRPPDLRSRLFTRIEGRMWIDKQDLRMAKGEATVTDTVTMGFIMARVNRGGHFEIEQMRMPQGIWLPKRIDIEGKARILLVESKTLDEEITFGQYQQISGRASQATEAASLQ